MTSGRDPQSLVLDHLESVQVRRRHLGEPDKGGIVQDGAQDGLIRSHQRFSPEVQLDPARAGFMMLRALVARRHNHKHEGRKWNWCPASKSSVWTRTGGYPRGEQCHAAFLGSNGQLFPLWPLHQGRTELVCPRLILHDVESSCQQREVIGVGRHVKVGDGAIWHKVVKEGWEDDHGEWCCW